MAAHLIKHALRAAAIDPGAGFGRSLVATWIPTLRATVLGPTPPHAHLVLTAWKPDGSPWFEHRGGMPELDENETYTVQLDPEGAGIADAGRCRFTLSLVDDSDGSGQLLHDGTLLALALPDGSFGIDGSSATTLGLVTLDVYDAHDAPKLRVTFVLEGPTEPADVAVHLLLDGMPVAAADEIEAGWVFESTSGTLLAREMTGVFGGVRGWDNDAAPGGGDRSRHLLDAHPGQYDVRVSIGATAVLEFGFDVACHRIVVGDGDIVEPDGACRPTLWRDAAPPGRAAGDLETARAGRGYGDLATAAVHWSGDDMHWFRNTAADPV